MDNHLSKVTAHRQNTPSLDYECRAKFSSVWRSQDRAWPTTALRTHAWVLFIASLPTLMFVGKIRLHNPHADAFDIEFLSGIFWGPFYFLSWAVFLGLILRLGVDWFSRQEYAGLKTARLVRLALAIVFFIFQVLLVQVIPAHRGTPGGF